MAKPDEISTLPAEYPEWMFAMRGAMRRPKPFVPAKS